MSSRISILSLLLLQLCLVSTTLVTGRIDKCALHEFMCPIPGPFDDPAPHLGPMRLADYLISQTDELITFEWIGRLVPEKVRLVIPWEIEVTTRRGRVSSIHLVSWVASIRPELYRSVHLYKMQKFLPGFWSIDIVNGTATRALKPQLIPASNQVGFTLTGVNDIGSIPVPLLTIIDLQCSHPGARSLMWWIEILRRKHPSLDHTHIVLFRVDATWEKSEIELFIRELSPLNGNALLMVGHGFQDDTFLLQSGDTKDSDNIDTRRTYSLEELSVFIRHLNPGLLILAVGENPPETAPLRSLAYELVWRHPWLTVYGYRVKLEDLTLKGGHFCEFIHAYLSTYSGGLPGRDRHVPERYTNEAQFIAHMMNKGIARSVFSAIYMLASSEVTHHESDSMLLNDQGYFAMVDRVRFLTAFRFHQKHHNVSAFITSLQDIRHCQQFLLASDAPSLPLLPGFEFRPTQLQQTQLAERWRERRDELDQMYKLWAGNV